MWHRVTHLTGENHAVEIIMYQTFYISVHSVIKHNAAPSKTFYICIFSPESQPHRHGGL